MTRYSRFLLYLIAVIVIMCPLLGRTNIAPSKSAPIGGGVSVESAHSSIRMESEEVTIRLKPRSYSVHAVFHMVNTGETTNEWVAFPKQGIGRPPGFGGVIDFFRFETWVNGKMARFHEKREVSALNYFLKGWIADLLNWPSSRKLTRDIRWMEGKVRFPGHIKTTIRINYEADYRYCGLGCQEAFYIYGTGRYWKGTIGKASFIIDGAAIGGVEKIDAGAGGWKRTYVTHRRIISKNILRYEIRDFEPNPKDRIYIML